MRNFIKTKHIMVALLLVVVLIFQQSGLSNYVKAVNVSHDLSNFITDVEIVNKDGTAIDQDENNHLILQKGVTYKVKLKFQENYDLQFDDDKENFYYTLPSSLTAQEMANPASLLLYCSDGQGDYQVGATYQVKDGKIIIVIDKNNENYQRLTNASNVNLNVDIFASLASDANTDKIEWSANKKTNIKINEESALSLNKIGTYKDGKFYYTVTVSSKGKSDNVQVLDQIEGTLLKYNNDLKITSNIQNPVNGTVNPNGKGFIYTIDQIQNDEVITLEYSADVDLAQIKDATFTLEQTQNTVRVKADNTTSEPSKSWNYDGKTPYPAPSKDGVLKDVVDGKQIIQWTIDINKDCTISVGGTTVSDQIIENSKMDYSGDGITIQRKDENGNNVGESFTVNWSQLEKTKTSWKYKIPDTDTKPYHYVITYETSTDVSDLKEDITVKNKVTHVKNDAIKGITIPATNHFSITKSHGQTITKDNVDFISTIEIPKCGFTQALKIIDTLPGTWEDSKWKTDQYKENSMQLYLDDQLLDTNTYDLIYTPSSSVGVCNVIEIVFKQDQLASLFPKSDLERKLTLKYSVNPDETWQKSNHTNTIKVIGDQIEKDASDSFKMAEPKINKKLLSSNYANGIYNFIIYLEGVDQDTIELNDVFDTSLFEFYEDKNNVWQQTTMGYGEHDYDAANSANGQINGGTIQAQQTKDGVKFSLHIDKQNGSYANYYAVRYFLKIKNDAALKTIKQEALNNGGTATYKNTVSWNKRDSQVTYDYKVNPIKKSVIIQPNNENKYTATFQVEINPEALTLNKGKNILAEDILSEKMRYVVGSATIKMGSTTQSFEPEYQSDLKKLTWMIPDNTAIILTYQARIIGSGNVSYSNVIKLLGYEGNSGNQNVYVDSSAGGGATHYSLNIEKRDKDTQERLANATFALFIKDQNDGQITPVFDKDNHQVTITTNQEGKAVISGTYSIHGWELIENQTYVLEEIQAPSHYKKCDNITFTIKKVAENENEYTTGDTLIIEDEKSNHGVLTLSKKVIGNEPENKGSGYAVTITNLDSQISLKQVVVEENVENLKITNQSIKFKIKKDEIIHISNLPLGTYRIEEVDDQSYVTSYKINNQAIDDPIIEITEDQQNFDIVNTYLQEAKVKFSGQKTITGVDQTNQKFTFELYETNDHYDLLSAKRIQKVSTSGTITKQDGQNYAFNELIYSKPSDLGMHYYLIKEQNTTSSFKENNQVYKIKVNVEANELGYQATIYSSNGETLDQNAMNFENTYDAQGQVSIELKKQYNQPLNGDDFNFILDEIDKQGNILVENKTTTKNDTDGKIYFTLNYNQPGMYYYQIHEEHGGEVLNGISYDDKKVKVKVDVVDQKNGILKTTLTDLNGKKLTSQDKTFTNIYETNGEITLKAFKHYNKTLKGNDFEFLLQETDEYGNRLVDGICMSAKNSEDGSIVFGKINYQDASTHYYTIQEKDANKAGITYDSTIYKIKVINQDENGKIISTIVDENDQVIDYQDIVFTNTYHATGQALIQLKKQYNLPLNGNDFNFILDEIDKQGNILVENKATAQNDTDGNIYFTMDYDQEGTYYYQIHEEHGGEVIDGINYDAKVVYVQVKVTDQDDGTLSITVLNRKGQRLSKEELLFTNDYQTQGHVQIQGIKHYNDVLLGNDFTFVMQSVDENGNLLEKTNENYAYLETRNNNQGQFIFNMNYTKPGIYYYKVSEKELTKSNIYFDPTVYHVKVIVQDQGNGTMTSEVYIDDSNEKTIEFTNKIQGDLIIEKSLNSIDQNQAFEFNVTINDQPYFGQAKLIFENNEQIIQIEDGKVYLKNKEKVLIESIPYLSTYHVEEKELDDYVSVVSDGLSTGVINQPVSSVKFVNTKLEGLMISKTQIGGDNDDEFKFHLTLDKTTYTGEAYLYDDQKESSVHIDQGEFTLKGGQVLLIKGLLPNTAYSIVEETSKGYTSYVNHKQTNEISGFINDESTQKIEYVNIKNKKEITFEKIGSDQLLENASLQVKFNDQILEQWVSSKEKKTISLEVGKNYTYHEECAPDGYLVAQDIQFKIDEQGQVFIKTDEKWDSVEDDLITMEDQPTRIQIDKIDKDTPVSLSGATLQIQDSLGHCVEQWISDGTIHEIIGILNYGETYKLVEINAPDHYKLADEITFTVDQPIIKLTMEDEKIEESSKMEVKQKSLFVDTSDRTNLLGSLSLFAGSALMLMMILKKKRAKVK